MNKINRWSIVFGGCLGLLIGLGLKSTVFSTQAEGSQPSGAQSGSSSNLSQGTSVGLQLERNQQDKAIAEALERTSRAQRWLWLATQAETASASEMPRLLRLAQDDEDLVKMLGGHWAKRDPEHMLRTLIHDWCQAQSINGNDDLRDQLIRDWVNHGHVQKLVAVLSEEDLYHKNHDDHDIAVNAIMRRDPGLGMELMSRWGVRNLMPDMKNVHSWVEKDPAAAALAISKISAVHARRKAMGMVAEAWADEPQAAMAFAKTSLTGKGYVELTSLITKQWTDSDLEGAIDYASSEKDPALLKALSGPLSAAWAEVDPAAALAWSQESLPAPARIEAVSAAIGVIAKNDLHQGAQLVQEMPPGGAKNRAAGSLLKAWVAQPHDVQSIGKWLVSLDDKHTSDRAFHDAEVPWSINNPKSAKAFLESDHGHLMPLGMVHQLISKDVKADPLAAMAWANSLEVAHAEVIKQAVIENWHDAQPDAANQWIARQKKANAK